MSLVVLRSWSDGQPKIRGIAPPDADDKNEIVVPDHKGRFVTAELPKIKDLPHPSNDKVGFLRQRFVKSNPSLEVQNARVGKYWNRKSLTSPGSNHSLSSNSLTPSPTNTNFEGRDEQVVKRQDKLLLSRESSLQSLSTDPESSPSSPLCGNSRYKSLGAELKATIPKRQIIRDSWVRESDSIFRKSELSKSTPSLNLSSLEDEGDGDGEDALDSRTNSSPYLRDRKSTSSAAASRPRPTSYFGKFSSWQDSVFGGEFEPKFGDKPASVVGVIKKEPSPKNSSETIQTSEALSLEKEVPVPAPVNNYYSTTTSSSSPSPPDEETLSPDGPTNAELRRVKRIAKKAVRSVSFELDLEFVKEPAGKSGESLAEFPVHRAVHPPNSLDIPEANTPEPEDLEDIEIEQVLTSENQGQSELVIKSPGENNLISDEDERIDLELEALRGTSSSSGSESERETSKGIPGDQRKINLSGQGQGVLTVADDDDADMDANNLRKSSQDVGQQRQGAKLNSHGYGNKHGSAWAQVPVQCVNRHVILPAAKGSFVPQPVPPPVKPELITNGPTAAINSENNNSSNYNNNGKNNLRRKNFCDDLLSNVVLQVPPLPPPLPSAIISNMEANPPMMTHQENHDGIIIFDEEDEFEGSETESIALSEQENSFEYLSVFQNVKVGPPTEMKSRPSEPLYIIGLDFGSTYSRHATLDKSTGVIQIGDAYRALVTSDGLTQGTKAIFHSMATKSKLIYKWRARQTFPYDPYDDEDNSSILEILFSHYANLLKDKLELRRRPLSNRSSSPDSGEETPSVQWNVSVHSSMEKKVVREAAFSSGLVKSTDELRLVTESTAAAVMGYQLLKAKSSTGSTASNSRRGADKTFLSINIGSTYFHTSGYRYSTDGNLQIIENPDSQTFQSPESLFTELLARVFSREFLLKYESRFTPSWVEILLRFQAMKDNYIKSNSECYLFLPISFFLEYFKCTGIQVPECIEENPNEGIAWDNNGAVRFTKDLMEDWLQPTLNFIKAKIKIRHYDAVVLSGGGANELLRKELEPFLPSTVQVHLIDNPEKTVVEGLVSLDSVRLNLKCPFSIGVGVMTPFDESTHPKEKCVTRSGKKWCSDVWDNLIRKGHPMTIGEVVLKRTYVGAQPGQNVLVLPIFRSDLDDPKLVTSPMVEKCCELRFEINKEKSWREVKLVIKCWDHELSILATGNDGDISHVVIDF